MKILFVKNLTAISESGQHFFQRMKVYNFSERLAREIILEKFGCEFGFVSELPVTMEGTI